MTYSIRLPQDVEARLEQLSARTGRKKSFYVKQAICEYIDDLEDIYLAERRLEDIRAGRTETIPLEEIMKRYGMED
ncbi:MAG: TraY domain-containing protein [Candidatus Melainabacteria bacterium]|nr:TraY domain-containing protein [Candidatus Melainabacteria bacterium]